MQICRIEQVKLKMISQSEASQPVIIVVVIFRFVAAILKIAFQIQEIMAP